MDDTPSRLVAAAEQLLADGGDEATSLRAISRAARSNAAAVHYHFGGRDALLAEVVARRVAPVQERRLELLAAVRAAHGDPVPVPSIVDALVRPDLELVAEVGVPLVRVLARVPAPPGSAVAVLLDGYQEEVAAALLPMLSAAVPGVDVDELRLRLRLVRAAVAATLAGEATVDAVAGGLVGFCVAGLAAPPSSRTEVSLPKAAKKKGKKRVDGRS